MAQNITLLGASYSDVPSVELPKTGGGTAQFDDTTIASNAASASDIANGKLAFVNGELVTGTASGGGATLITKSITANGTYNASSDNADGYSSVTVNVSGGGLVYETGTWTPTNDIARGEIAFTNTHDNPPCLVAIYDSSSPSTLGTYSSITELFFDPYGLNGDGFPSSRTSVNYAIAQYTYTGSSVSTSGQRRIFVSKSSITSDSSATSVRYWIKPDRFYPYTDSTSRYWRAGRTYKWIAVWAPTS